MCDRSRLFELPAYVPASRGERDILFAMHASALKVLDLLGIASISLYFQPPQWDGCEVGGNQVFFDYGGRDKNEIAAVDAHAAAAFRFERVDYDHIKRIWAHGGDPDNTFEIVFFRHGMFYIADSALFWSEIEESFFDLQITPILPDGENAHSLLELTRRILETFPEIRTAFDASEENDR